MGIISFYTVTLACYYSENVLEVESSCKLSIDREISVAGATKSVQNLQADQSEARKSVTTNHIVLEFLD